MIVLDAIGTILVVWTMLFFFAFMVVWGCSGWEACEAKDAAMFAARGTTAILATVTVIFTGLYILGC